MTHEIDRLRNRWKLIGFLFSHLFIFVSTQSQPANEAPRFASTDAAGVNPTQIWLFERQRLNLKCPVVTNGTMIQWIKDGQQLLDQQAAFLDIPAVSRIDSGLYRCYAENELGAAYSWAMNVTVQYLDGFEAVPESRVVVPLEGNFVINPPAVRSSVLLDLSWRWYFEDTEIFIGDQYYITVTGALVVLNPPNRLGNYSVHVHATNSPTFTHRFLVEADPEAIERRVSEFRIVYPPLDSTFVVGRARPFQLHGNGLAGVAVFECVPMAMGRFPADIKWKLNGELLVAETNGVHVEHRGHRLILMNVQRFVAAGEHSASVVCEASSGTFKSTAVARLDLLEVPKIDRNVLPSELSIPTDESLRLKCRAENSWPRPKITWYFNGKRIHNSSTETFKRNRIASDDYGVYQCDAVNTVGTDSATIWIHEPVEEKSIFSAAASDDVPLIMGSISIIRAPEDIIAKPGADVTFHCSTNDPHNVRIVWTHNGEPLDGDPRHLTNRTSLTIHAVRPSDAGQYECTATAVGTILTAEVEPIRSSARLIVRGSHLIELGPSNQSSLIGTNVRMPCQLAAEFSSSQRLPIQQWFRNGQRIPNDGDPLRRISIEADGSLLINQVGPDSIGTYKCSVTASGETETAEASLIIIEKPAMPQNVVAELVKLNDSVPSLIRVSWKEGFDGNSPLIKHNIEMRIMGTASGLWSEWETVVKDVQNEQCCSAIVDNLRPSSTAEFRVVPFNRYGAGRPSAPSANVTMPQQPPAAAPREVRGSPRSSSSIIVQWQPPPADQWNGDILGYHVRYRLAGYTLPWNERNISNPRATNILLEPLITWRDYEIQVAAYNDRGSGVYSHPIEVAPLESAPMQSPQNVEVEVINSTDIKVSFDPLDQQLIPGVNLGYKIELWKGPAGGSLYRLVRVFPDYSRLSQRIGNLEKFGHYNVTVLCFTSPGDGPRSDPIEVETEEDVPGPVGSINFDQVQSNSVVIQWDSPPEPNGIIIKYLLRHWESNQPDQKSSIMVSGAENNATIEQLRASTQYSVDIQALTRVGAGPRMEAKFESGVPPELPARPTAVVVSDVSARSAVLQFIPGFDGHSYIKRWIVEAKVGVSTVYQQIFNISAPKARSFTVEKLRPHTRYQLRLIAENIRGRGAPSEPTRSFETRETNPENPPEKLYAEPVSSDRIQIVWSPLLPNQWNGEPIGYLILYRAARAVRLGSSNSAETETKEEEWKEMRSSSPKAGELFLSNLEPFTTYQIKMFSENSFGRSDPSEIISATTYESVPSIGPLHVEAEMEQQTLRVRWDDLPSRQKRGAILGFRVRLVPEEEYLRSQFTHQIELPGSEVRTAAFSKLRPFTAYRVFVSAFTFVGDGPSSTERPVVRTPEDLPEPPANVHFSKVTERTANIVWEAPQQPNGEVTSYEIRYWRIDRPESKGTVTTVRHSLFEFSANGLDPNVTYIFALKAQNKVGFGAETQLPLYTSNLRPTLPTPPTPQQSKQKPPSATGLWIRWEPPAGVAGGQRAAVRGVEVEYQRSNDAVWKRLPFSVMSQKNEVFIDGLLPNQPYHARIRFISDFDRSTWSDESMWLKTLEASPSVPPKDVEAKPFESASIRLQWTPLEPIEWNSDRIGYRVLYRIYPSNDSFLVDEVPMNESPVNGKMEHIVKKLASFHHYAVQVQSYNSLGASKASTPPAFVYVGYSIPKQTIQNLNATAISSTSIHLKWDNWIVSDDDVISGYRVRYSPVSESSASVKEGTESSEEIMVTEKSEITLSDLRKFTEYQISVSGYNRAGDGQTAVARVRTNEDLPGPVGSLVFSDILLDSVNVSWTPPTQPNGLITTYIVTYQTRRLPEAFRKEIQESTPMTFLLAEKLEENTTYSFSVQAMTSVGAGAEVMGNVTIGYNRGAPGAPQRPIVLPEETGFVLRWADGPSGSTPIKGHLIQAKRIGIVRPNNRSQPMMADEMGIDLGDGVMATAAASEMRRKARHLMDFGYWTGLDPRLESMFNEIEVTVDSEGHERISAEIPPNTIQRTEEAEPTRSPHSRHRHPRHTFENPFAPRHIIGEWNTISTVLGEQTEYRVSYRQLEPSSYYVLRVFARNDLGVGLPSEESDRLEVPETIPADPFYTKWWFLVIVGLVIMMVVIIFVATLCVTSAASGKKKAEKNHNAYDTHQLADGFVVSYELKSSQQQRPEENNGTPRPGTHTSWLSNEIARPPVMPTTTDGGYGSIASGLNGMPSSRANYSSAYQQLATDAVPAVLEPSNRQSAVSSMGGAKTPSIASGYVGLHNYAAKRHIVGASNALPQPGGFWTGAREEADYVAYGNRSSRPSEVANFLNEVEDPMANVDDAELQAERSFASHYQSNPLEENYRATWRKTREQSERARTPSAQRPPPTSLMAGAYGYPNRPDSVATSSEATPPNGSDIQSASTQSTKSAGIQLRHSTEFESPKNHPNAPFNIGNSVTHGFSSFV